MFGSAYLKARKMHLINFKELSSQELIKLVDLGLEVKANPKKYLKTFQGKSAALIFQKTSTRTRVSFEVAMTQLGGHALFIDWRSTNFTLSDVSTTMTRNPLSIAAATRLIIATVFPLWMRP